MDRDQVEQLAAQCGGSRASAFNCFRQRLEKLHGRIDRTLDRAEGAEDITPLAPLFNAASKNLEMLGRATGELEPNAGMSLSIQIVSPATESRPDQIPRITFSSVDQIEAGADPDDTGIMQIGLLQPPG